MRTKRKSRGSGRARGAKNKRHAATFKTQVAVAAMRHDTTTNELGSRFDLHPTQVAHWKKQLLDGAASIFENGPATSGVDQERLIADLYEQLGRAHAELEWLKKSMDLERRREASLHRTPSSTPRHCRAMPRCG